MSVVSQKPPPIWFMEGVSTLTPYNVALVLMVNHYCNEPPRSKLAVVLLDCIKYKNLSLNQLITVLNQVDDSDLGSEFMDYLDKVFKSSSLGKWVLHVLFCFTGHLLLVLLVSLGSVYIFISKFQFNRSIEYCNTIKFISLI